MQAAHSCGMRESPNNSSIWKDAYGCKHARFHLLLLIDDDGLTAIRVFGMKTYHVSSNIQNLCFCKMWWNTKKCRQKKISPENKQIALYAQRGSTWIMGHAAMINSLWCHGLSALHC
ncbi:hypothetical protein TNCV_1913641 [Trichonephila clavipes]|nr:hypothetical protein TNCV_1913641 [Trichonephila clavipes]